MTEPSAPPRATDASASPAIRTGFVLAVALLVLLLVVAARSEPVTTEARLGARVELVELIRIEQQRVERLAEKVDELSAELVQIQAANPADPELTAALQQQIEELAVPAGLTAVRGPGVTVTLTDSPLSTSPTGDLNDLVVHEQDLQGVINALWAGGAEAISVMGQRVLATTAIRCVGNTLLLHGAVYSPPYVIEAIGDAPELRAALDRDPAVVRYRAAVAEFEVGFDLVEVDELLLPGSETGGAPPGTPLADGSA